MSWVLPPGTSHRPGACGSRHAPTSPMPCGSMRRPGSSPNGDDLAITRGGGQQLCVAAVIVATGSSFRRLGVPGEDDLIGAGVHFCATCDGPFYRGAGELLVIGGGNSGLEEGLFLAQFADRIRVVEYAPTLKASALLQDKVAAIRSSLCTPTPRSPPCTAPAAS